MVEAASIWDGLRATRNEQSLTVTRQLGISRLAGTAVTAWLASGSSGQAFYNLTAMECEPKGVPWLIKGMPHILQATLIEQTEFPHPRRTAYGMCLVDGDMAIIQTSAGFKGLGPKDLAGWQEEIWLPGAPTTSQAEVISPQIATQNVARILDEVRFQ